MPTAREQLKKLLQERAYQYSPDAPFTLASGKKSPYYFNCKAVSLTGRGLNLLGEVLFDELEHFPKAKAVGGLTLGADPLATALAAYASAHGRDLNAFVIRKEAKGHGTKKWIEGEIPEGTPIVVLDDVCTTGKSTLQAIERAAQGNLKILGALVLVDRQEESGMENIRAALKKAGGGEARAVYRVEEFPR